MSKREGWVFIGGSPKWHYVVSDKRSLCRRWLYLGTTAPELGNDDSRDNCAACRKALAKANAKEAARSPQVTAEPSASSHADSTLAQRPRE